MTLPGAVRKNRRRTGAESSRGVVQKNGVTDEAFQTRRRQLKREASATDDESAGGNVTVPSSVDGNAAQCPGTLAAPSATSSLSSNRVDLPCSMSQGRRATASGAKQAAPATAKVDGPSASQCKADGLQKFEQHPTLKIDALDGEEFLNAKDGLLARVGDMISKLGSEKKGVIGDIRSEDSKLKSRGGNTDDLDDDSETLVTALEAHVQALEETQSMLKKAKKVALPELAELFNKVVLEVNNLERQVNDHLRCLKRKNNTASKGAKGCLPNRVLRHWEMLRVAHNWSTPFPRDTHSRVTINKKKTMSANYDA